MITTRATLHSEEEPVRRGAALQAPPSPDYVPGLEEPEQALPSPDYVPDDGDDEWTLRRMRMTNDIEADRRMSMNEMSVEIDDEEHLAPAYPLVVALPANCPISEETEAF
ncbi:hypothetical protein Tco_0459365 [Tanacetum coccineum]